MKIFFIFDRFSKIESQFSGGTNIRIHELIEPIKEVQFITLRFRNQKKKEDNIFRLATKESIFLKNYNEYLSCSSNKLIFRKKQFLKQVYWFMKLYVSRDSIVHITGETYTLINKLQKLGFKKIIYTYNIIHSLQYFSPLFQSEYSKQITPKILWYIVKKIFKDVETFIRFFIILSKTPLFYLIPPQITFPLISDIIPKQFSKRVIFVSKNSLLRFQKLYDCPMKKSLVIRNGLNPLFINDRLCKIKKKKSIILVGRLHPIKGFETFIMALRDLELKNLFSGYSIIMCCFKDPTQLKYYSYIKFISKKIKKNSITIKENLTQKQLIPLYKKTSLFISTSLNEPFGMNIIEAISTGSYIISSETSGAKEISKFAKIHFYNGSIRSLSKVLLEYQDKSKHEIIREVLRNKSKIHNFNWKQLQKELKKAYLKL